MTFVFGALARMRFVASIPVILPEIDIHDDNVGLKLFGEFDGLRAVCCLAHNLNVRLDLHQAYQPFSYDLMVVNDKDAAHDCLLVLMDNTGLLCLSCESVGLFRELFRFANGDCHSDICSFAGSGHNLNLTAGISGRAEPILPR